MLVLGDLLGCPGLNVGHLRARQAPLRCIFTLAHGVHLCLAVTRTRGVHPVLCSCSPRPGPLAWTLDTSPASSWAPVAPLRADGQTFVSPKLRVVQQVAEIGDPRSPREEPHTGLSHAPAPERREWARAWSSRCLSCLVADCVLENIPQRCSVACAPPPPPLTGAPCPVHSAPCPAAPISRGPRTRPLAWLWT